MVLLDVIKSVPAYQNILQNLKAAQMQPGLGLPRAARLPVLSALYSDIKQPLFLLTDRADHAINLFDEVKYWNHEIPVLLFGEPTPMFYEDASWGNAIRFQRLKVFSYLAFYHLPYVNKPVTPPIIISSAKALMTRSMSRREYLKSVKLIKTGEDYQLESLVRRWIEEGYNLENTVSEIGQLCRRGGLIDIWPPTTMNPARLEFDGNKIETIRYFDPGSQRKIEDVEAITVAPAREFLIPTVDTLKTDGNLSEFNIATLHPFTSNLLDFLPRGSPILIDDLSLIETEISQAEEQAVILRKEMEDEGIIDQEFPVPYFSWTEINENIQSHPWLELGYSMARLPVENYEKSDTLSSQFVPVERFSGRLKPFFDYLEKSCSKKNSVLVVSRQAVRLRELWSENELFHNTSSIMFMESSLSGGWSLGNWSLVTDAEIFGWERPQPRKSAYPFAETPEMVYEDIFPGDLVVHIDYGIGLFRGLVSRQLEGIEHEFLCVEFKNNDQVYVPIHQADRLSKYISSAGGVPSLGNISTQGWAETKQRVNDAVQEVARDLLELYAKRSVATGYAFQQDTPWQDELESSFPYAETPDQLKALEEIKRDMEAPRPMDRLLCGDVGYGKTEIALRASFKAIMDGKQVAILVPTTVLAQQHFDTFQQRLSAFPVSVEMLSRFRTQMEQQNIISSLQNGGIDIIIGTHRLISTDVKFKELGLVIVDEEQRFGVTHKEKLKRLRTEVDILTLTATPIPRTLYMALAGVRDISNLNTPPEERLPIVTHIGPYSPKLVRQAVLREHERGGQVFFVHNRVQTIYAMRLHLEKLVPEIRIAIAHGQMPEKELAGVMRRFTAGDVDLLLTTSIIESGLDIPNANTLIVDRGDTFGLAQLYQLRGRVGRGAVRAYAYFFRHRKLSPTLEGQERLEIIAENNKLGSGYSIAMRDLEMRGAGELLGTRQSGHIASVGFHLYTRLLAMAVRALHLPASINGETRDIGKNMQELEVPVSVDLPQPVSIPEEYVPDKGLRLRLYRRIADIPDEKALEALIDEFADRFGILPMPVENLFFQIKVKLRAEKARLASVSVESGQIVLRYPTNLADQVGIQLPDMGKDIRGGKNAYWCSFGKDKNWQNRLLDLLDKLIDKINA